MADVPYQVTDRRPIGARHWRISQQTARWMARRGLSPNGISVAGMMCGLLAGGALAATAHAPGWARAAWLAGAAFMQLRLLANMFDGMVAIERGKASAVGELFNEVPDRVSDTAVLVGAGYAVGGDIVLGYAAACVAMFTAYVRTTGKAAGAPHIFCGPMAKQQRMALMTVLAVYLALAPQAWQPAWGLMAVGLWVVIVGGLLTAARRLARIAAYLRKQPI
ncbi:MAG: CDP-alcohol phosphatidyltransferase family protein [Candidatus Hydrogenedentes bacterium]|nr:CDP-alcohol phosphatidyltransferase family protein [Candidatus Hydrogenedentota bacterium]MBI3119879.1 CDP-alcohol phosphatidyltransferase family protein [Candidatus Hydrogenedentota bacterium]